MTISLPDLAPPIATRKFQQRIESLRQQYATANNVLPFHGTDVSVGVENEFQVAVEGNNDQVDLPRTIIESNYYRNLTLRARRGDLNPRLLTELNSFLHDQNNGIWENSWVRFPRHLLSAYSSSVLNRDLLADKNNPTGPARKDSHRFLYTEKGEPWLRIPVSYLLKLALAEVIGRFDSTAPLLHDTGEHLMEHLLNDNCSPEITSFTVSREQGSASAGHCTAAETSRRFFSLHLLISFANQAFRLQHHGQTCYLYLAPNPPARQKQLNELISDQFYRELFLNPCLSGWQQGEIKKEYMGLCHRTLSRSQLNTITKLKEAGIIVNNLVVLPNTSSTSLANNGTHITLGSRALTHWYHQPEGFLLEKYFGDLVIKIVEHFLPLFVTTCSAAPYRLAFTDFHPEKVLGYLPHELDYTHLRMLWRRWKKKASLRFCGHSLTPVGPLWLDRLISTLLRLHGDYLPDVRLIDYLVALQSVEQSPALDGMMHNQERLKRDLSEMGVFDSRMAIYLPYRMRALAAYGFSGFEGRHYSLFPDLGPTFALAVDLQILITKLAYRWVLAGSIHHGDIPDDPCTESERRQIFFAAAIGVPTVFVRANTGNTFLRRIIDQVEQRRPSRRYRGFIRIEVAAYQQSCLKLLQKECAMQDDQAMAAMILDPLEAMLKGTAPTAAARLTTEILSEMGRNTNPMHVRAADFNRAAEIYYRTNLLQTHLKNGLETLIEDGRRLDACSAPSVCLIREQLTGTIPAALLIGQIGSRVLTGKAAIDEIQRLLLLILLIIHCERQTTATT
ncbi:hypothetical protein [Desulfobulbus alkaliphilus]|uniref:hypothetical protein n=1 Tax=Desulfobulbus alkaliphilus TaxID=869814 RepID=UPI0019626DF1|nr:hypothetical protein [Desulfobulbus alkaliphilus]MBM9536095.1 hypothetical protein [Desulfobulbus alkaliphilus]